MPRFSAALIGERVMVFDHRHNTRLYMGIDEAAELIDVVEGVLTAAANFAVATAEAGEATL